MKYSKAQLAEAWEAGADFAWESSAQGQNFEMTCERFDRHQENPYLDEVTT